MNTTSKHEAMYEYIKQYPPLAQILYFNSIQDLVGATSLNPVYSDKSVLEYTSGDAEKEYIFAIAMMKEYDSTGTSDINVAMLQEANGFMDWIDKQNELGNFPSFPKGCYINRISNLQNMPSLAGRDDQGVAEYMMQCKVEYTEERS